MANQIDQRDKNDKELRELLHEKDYNIRRLKRRIAIMAVGAVFGLVVAFAAFFYTTQKKGYENIGPQTARCNAPSTPPKGFFKITMSCKPKTGVRFKSFDVNEKDQTACIEAVDGGVENEVGFTTYLDTAKIDMVIIDARVRSLNANTNKFKFVAKLFAADGQPVDSIVINNTIRGTTRSFPIRDTLQFRSIPLTDVIARNP